MTEPEPTSRIDDGRELPLRTKLAFGIGSIGETVYLGMFNTFIAIFYNQALGLSNSLVGLAVLVALVGDAISDPAIGILSDRWRSRLGRRHPFLFAAPIPLAIAIWSIFNPPDSLLAKGEDGGVLAEWWLFAWLLLWTTLSRFCVTLYNIPHLALGGEIVRSPRERSSLFSINAIIGYASGALFGFVAWSYFDGKTTSIDGTEIPGQLIATHYGPLSIAVAAAILIFLSLCAVGTFARGRQLSEPAANAPPASLLYFLRKIFSTFRNYNYLFLLIGFFFFMISSGLYETFNVFVYTYFWELPAESIRWLALAALPGVVLGASSAPVLMARWDRKPVLLTAIVGLGVFSQLPIDLRLLGWFPSNDSDVLLPLLLANSLVFATCLGIGGVAVLTMIGDIIDENELFTGEREEGLFYSARAFFAKLSGSVGALIAGIALDAFVKLPFEAVPGEIDQDIVDRLGIVAGPIMGFAALASLVFYSRYRLTRERHAEICAELERRKAADEAAEIAD